MRQNLVPSLIFFNLLVSGNPRRVEQFLSPIRRVRLYRCCILRLQQPQRSEINALLPFVVRDLDDPFAGSTNLEFIDWENILKYMKYKTDGTIVILPEQQKHQSVAPPPSSPLPSSLWYHDTQSQVLFLPPERSKRGLSRVMLPLALHTSTADSAYVGTWREEQISLFNTQDVTYKDTLPKWGGEVCTVLVHIVGVFCTASTSLCCACVCSRLNLSLPSSLSPSPL